MMDTELKPVLETADRIDAERSRLGWGFWALWVCGLAVFGALSCRVAVELDWIGTMVAPVAMPIFGILAGVVQGFALRRLDPPIWRWILASSLAGVLAGCVSFFAMLMGVVATVSPLGLLAGWACAWAAYGAVLGAVLLRVFPGRGALLVSLAGWAAAGIVGGVVGWAKDLFKVRPNSFVPFPSVSLTSSMEDILLVGAVYGLTGGAITAAALVWLLRKPALPKEKVARTARDTRQVLVAGMISGLIAAALCSYLTPLVLLVHDGVVSDLADLADFGGAVLSDSVLCLPAIAAISIPLGIGGGFAGLLIGRARGRPDLRRWIRVGAAAGGVAGYVVGSLLINAVLGL